MVQLLLVPMFINVLGPLIPPVSKHLHPAYDPGRPPPLWSSEFQCRSLRTSHLGGEGQIQDSKRFKQYQNR